MDKDNTFRSSSFFMEVGDVLHVLIGDVDNDTLSLYLVNSSDLVEYAYSLRECDIVITTTKIGQVSLYLKGAGYVSVEWGDGDVSADYLHADDYVRFLHTYTAGGTITIKNSSHITDIGVAGNNVTSIIIPTEIVAITTCDLEVNDLTTFDYNVGWTVMHDLLLSDNSLTEASVNSILVNADTSGITSGTIDLELNAAPTGAGLVAKANLIAKGVTVFTA